MLGFTPNEEAKYRHPLSKVTIWPICRDNLEMAQDMILVLFTSRKLHMGFWSVEESVTLSDLEWPWLCIIHAKQLMESTASNSLKSEPQCLGQKCRSRILLFDNTWFIGNDCVLSLWKLSFLHENRLHLFYTRWAHKDQYHGEDMCK